jgi:hypothetical protein
MASTRKTPAGTVGKTEPETWQIGAYIVTRDEGPDQYVAKHGRYPDIEFRGNPDEIGAAIAGRTHSALREFDGLLRDLPMATKAAREDDLERLQELIRRYPAEASAILAAMRTAR